MKNYLSKGTITELIATFDDNENLDLKMFADEVDFQLQAGVDGLFLADWPVRFIYQSRRTHCNDGSNCKESKRKSHNNGKHCGIASS